MKSGDDGEDTMQERLQEELEALDEELKFMDERRIEGEEVEGEVDVNVGVMEGGGG